MRMLRRAAATLVAGACVAAPVPAFGAAEPEVPDAPRTLIVKGAEPGVAEVRIPRPTVVNTALWFRRPDGPNRHTRIGGDGPFTGIVMTPADDEVGEGADRVIVLGQFRGCSFGCSGPRPVNYTAPFRDRTRIPAGVYRIYFMSGQAGGRVRIDFLRGPRGRLVVVPGEPVEFAAAVPSATSSSNEYAVSAGSDYDLGGTGIRFSVFDVRLADGGSSSSFGTCLYESSAAPPEDSRFLPGCPEGGGAERYAYPVAPEARRFYYQDYQPMYDAGTWAFGAWHQSSIAVEDVVHGAVFLTV